LGDSLRFLEELQHIYEEFGRVLELAEVETVFLPDLAEDPEIVGTPILISFVERSSKVPGEQIGGLRLLRQRVEIDLLLRVQLDFLPEERCALEGPGHAAFAANIRPHRLVFVLFL